MSRRWPNNVKNVKMSGNQKSSINGEKNAEMLISKDIKMSKNQSVKNGKSKNVKILRNLKTSKNV